MQVSVITLFLLWFLALPVMGAQASTQSVDDGAGYKGDRNNNGFSQEDRERILKRQREEHAQKLEKRKQGRESRLESSQEQLPEKSDQAAAAASQPIDYATTAEINYDKASDQLNVVASQASLKSVLGRIAQLSGIEVLFDDAADEPLSIELKATSLEDGLKRILKGRNSSLRYTEDDKKNLLLVGVTVLPVGEQGTGNARQLLAIDDEAYYRARSQMTNAQLETMDKSAERWQARLDELPPEQRAKMEARLKERMLKQAQADEARAKRKARDQKVMTSLNQMQQQQTNRMLEKLPPDAREDFEKRRAEAREQTRQILLQQKQSESAN